MCVERANQPPRKLSEQGVNNGICPASATPTLSQCCKSTPGVKSSAPPIPTKSSDRQRPPFLTLESPSPFF
ncbi:unnamed protein product [Mesocestoides corti]|uniref:Uncharacterized protein n=1 Tax=Mesocestoides corti TaxID=53468 RepID=A0A0R3UL49_MESCO|nr:unnamed protein product [Mesocestoides corti]